jgi:hypothetical protein
VTWRNNDDIPHTVTLTTRAFKSKALDTDNGIRLHSTRQLRVCLLAASAHDGNDCGRAGDPRSELKALK